MPSSPLPCSPCGSHTLLPPTISLRPPIAPPPSFPQTPQRMLLCFLLWTTLVSCGLGLLTDLLPGHQQVEGLGHGRVRYTAQYSAEYNATNETTGDNMTASVDLSGWIVIDEGRYAFFDLSQYDLDEDAVLCNESYVACLVPETHPLVVDIQTAVSRGRDVVVTGSAQWSCDGTPLFRRAEAVHYDRDDDVLILRTADIAYWDVIEDAEIGLVSSNLMRDPEADDEGESADPEVPASGAQAQHRAPDGRRLLGFWSSIRNFLRKAKKVFDAVVHGKVNVDERLTLLNKRFNEKWKFTYGALTVTLQATGHMNVALVLRVRIRSYALKRMEVRLHGRRGVLLRTRVFLCFFWH